MGMSKKCTAVDSLSDASSTSSRGSKVADGPSKKPATIEMSEERKGGEEYSDRRLFISNFPFSWHEDDLRAFLEDYGPVMEVNIVYNERGSKGFGFATIDDPDRCYRARMELNHTVVQGRRVEGNGLMDVHTYYGRQSGASPLTPPPSGSVYGNLFANPFNNAMGSTDNFPDQPLQPGYLQNYGRPGQDLRKIWCDPSAAALRPLDGFDRSYSANVMCELFEFPSWVPGPIQAGYKTKGIGGLFRWQLEVLEGALTTTDNVLYAAPTSAGKSLVAELLCLRAAMADQKNLWRNLDYEVAGFVGGHQPVDNEWKCAVCTMEKASSILNRMIADEKYDELGIVVVDELHMVSEDSRGNVLEDLIAKVQLLRKMTKNTLRIVAMSATLDEDPSRIEAWIGTGLYQTDFRPIDLAEHLAIGRDLFLVKTMEKQKELPQEFFFPQDRLGVAGWATEGIHRGYSILVFCSSKADVENTASDIAKASRELQRRGVLPQMVVNEDSPLWALKQELERLGEIDENLIRCLKYGIGFHHAGLTVEERECLEKYFRKGAIRVLVSTSTLSSGVNLPANRVIMKAQTRGPNAINAVTYRQMAGRAGRMGLAEKGESIVIVSRSELELLQKLIARNQIFNEFIKRDPRRLVLEATSTKICRNKSDVEQLLGYLLYPSTHTAEEIIDELSAGHFITKNMSAEGVLEIDSTQLGMATINSSLPPYDALRVFSDLKKAVNNVNLNTELHLLFLIVPVSVSLWNQVDWQLLHGIYTTLDPISVGVARIVGVCEAMLVRLMRGTTVQNETQSICKRFFAAMVLQDLINEKPMAEVAQKFRLNRGSLQAFQQHSAMHAAMVVTFSSRIGYYMLHKVLEEFSYRLAFGIRRELSELVQLEGIDGSRARAFHEAGITSLNLLANADPKDITRILQSVVPFESDSADHTVAEWLFGAGLMKLPDAVRALMDGANAILLQKIRELGWVSSTQVDEIKRNKRALVAEAFVEHSGDAPQLEIADSGMGASVISTQPAQKISRPLISAESEPASSEDTEGLTRTPTPPSNPHNISTLSIADVSNIEESFSMASLGIYSVPDYIIIDPNQSSDLFDGSPQPLRTQNGQNYKRDSGPVTGLKRLFTKATAPISPSTSSPVAKVLKGTTLSSDESLQYLAAALPSCSRHKFSIDYFDNVTTLASVQASGDPSVWNLFLERCSRSAEASIACALQGEWNDETVASIYILLPESPVVNIIHFDENASPVIALEERIVQLARILKEMDMLYVFDVTRVALALRQTDVRLEVAHPFDVKYLSYLVLEREPPFRDVYKNAQLTSKLSHTMYFGANIESRIAFEALSLPALYNSYATMAKRQHKSSFLKPEFEAVEAIVRMTSNGIRLNKKVWDERLAQIRRRLIELREDFADSVKQFVPPGSYLDIDDPKDVETLLYDILKLPHEATAKGKRSTSKEMLERIPPSRHPAPRLVIDYRHLKFVLKQQLVPLRYTVKAGPTAEFLMVFPKLNLCTNTGRIMTTSPNIQCLSQHERMLIVPREGWILIGIDYAQLELRVLAHMCGDAKLCELLRRPDYDIFADMAKNMDCERQAAKVMCYGIVYGIGKDSLAKKLDCTTAEAGELINKFYKLFPRVKTYINEVKEQARGLRKVSTFLGRTRNVAIGSNAEETGAEARRSVNFIIQGTASEIFKKAFVAVDRLFREEAQGEIVLPVHDELLVQVPNQDATINSTCRLLRATMENALPLTVPLFVKINIGVTSWGKLSLFNEGDNS
ncbi:unnamed protein product, partial [Mesorhabditis spiculigera]